MFEHILAELKICKCTKLVIRIKAAKQVGSLYHYSSFINLLRILKSDTLKADASKMVSFTRNKNLHNQALTGISSDVRLTVDGDKLSENYKLEPYNYHSNLPFIGLRYYKHSQFEAEERTLKHVKFLSKYLKSITIFKKRWPEKDLGYKGFEIILERFLGMGNVTFDNYVEYLKQLTNVPIEVVEK